MALGALSTPTVSTPFSGESASMVPMISGVGDGLSSVEKMSPFESMQLVFLDIRDGISNLGSIFKEKISGLNSHLAFRLETLNNTLISIAELTVKDFNLEKLQLKLAEANKKNKDRETSLQDGDVKKEPTFIDSLKEGFGELKDKLSGSDIFKALLLGLGAYLLYQNIDKVRKLFTKFFVFIAEVLIPGLKDLNNDVESWVGLGGLTKLGIMANTLRFLTNIGVLITKFLLSPLKLLGKLKIFQKIGGLIDKVRNAYLSFSFTKFFDKLKGFFTTIGKFLTRVSTNITGFFSGVSKLTGLSLIFRIGALFLRFIAWPLQIIIGLYGGITAALKKFKEGNATGMDIALAFTVGVYDILVGATLNLLTDLLGWVAKKLGFEQFGQSLQDLDFSFDTIKTGMINLKNSITDYFFNLLQRAKRKFGFKSEPLRNTPKIISDAENKRRNEVSDLPGSMKGGESKAAGYVEKGDLQSVEALNALSAGGELDSVAVATDLKLDNIVKGFDMDENNMTMDSESSSMIAKNNSLLAELNLSSSLASAPPGNITMMADNKQVSNDTVVSNNTTMVSNQRVDHTDLTSMAILNVLKR